MTIEVPDRIFYGYKISAQTPTRAVLFFNGNGYGAASAIGRIGEAFVDDVTDVYVISYAVSPDSPPRVEQVYALSEQLARRASQGGIAKEHISVVGHSLGGWVALHLATTPLVGCVAVAGTGTTAMQTAERLLPRLITLLMRLQPTEDVRLLDNVAQAGMARAPVLVVGSDRDETMPESESRKIFAALPDQGRQIYISPTVTHNAYFRDDVVINRIRDFIHSSCAVEPSSGGEQNNNASDPGSLSVPTSHAAIQD